MRPRSSSSLLFACGPLALGAPACAPAPSAPVVVNVAGRREPEVPKPPRSDTPAHAKPLAIAIVTMALPPDTGPILGVASSAPGDAWILTKDARVLHLVGDRVVRTYTPEPCFTTNQFTWTGISTSGSYVRLHATVQDAHAKAIDATLIDERWTCYERRTAVPELDCPWDHAWGGDEGDVRLCSLGGATLPAFDAPFSPIGLGALVHASALAMTSPHDGFLAVSVRDPSGKHGELHRWDGVSWTRVALLDRELEVTQLWADGHGGAWMLADTGAKSARMVVVHHDGRTAERVALPPLFAPRWIGGDGPDSVWMLGAGRRIARWNGVEIEEGEAPFETSGASVTLGGELWLVGAAAGQLAHTASRSARP